MALLEGVQSEKGLVRRCRAILMGYSCAGIKAMQSSLSVTVDSGHDCAGADKGIWMDDEEVLVVIDLYHW